MPAPVYLTCFFTFQVLRRSMFNLDAPGGAMLHPESTIGPKGKKTGKNMDF